MESRRSRENEERRDGAKSSNCMASFRRSGRNRESWDEIVKLEAELRRAYVAKELQTQLMERETERYVENVRRKRAEKLMRLEQQAAMEDDLKQRSEKLKRSEDYRNELTEQIKRKEIEREMMIEEDRRDREILTEVDAIREQGERFETMERKNESAECLRRGYLVQLEMKQIRLQENMEADAKKMLEDEEYLAEVDRRNMDARLVYERRVERRESIACEIAKLLINKESRKRETEMLLIELIAEDTKWEFLRKDEQERMKRKKMKEELAADLEEQITFEERCKLYFAQRDKAFAEEIMKKIMEDEKIARLSAIARRRVQLQYREDLNRLIETRQKIRNEELLIAFKEEEKENLRERMEIERIAEERKRLLENHVANVAKFLRKNTIFEEERENI